MSFCGCMGGWFLVSCYYNELDEYRYAAGYIRHMIPGGIYVMVLILAVLCVHSLVSDEKQINTFFRGSIAACVSFIQGCFLYTPNPFKDNLGGIYHIDAYTNSIMNAVAFSPYEMYSSSIYGHHGLFYMLPVKVFHTMGLSYWNAMTIVIGIVGFITFIIEYWCISQIINNDIIYYLAVLANAVVSFQIYFNQYYQVLPHRYLFQALMVAGSIFAYRRSDKIVLRVCLWILCGLSMVWNIETGAVVTAVWWIALVYLDAKKAGGYMLKNIILNAVFAIMVFIGGYALINLYNLSVGGSIVPVSTYIYPIGSTSYRIDMLELSLMNPANGYFLVIAVFAGMIGLNLMDYIFGRMKESGFLAFMVSIMGFGVFTYYMNRAVSTNASIVSFAFVLVIAHICDGSATEIMRAKKHSGEVGGVSNYFCIRIIVREFFLIVLTGTAIASVATIGSTIREKLGTTWETDSLDAFVSEAEDIIPDDAVAFGSFTTQLFALMDKRTGIYIADWEDIGEDLNPEASNMLNGILREGDFNHIVVNMEQAEYLPQGIYDEISDVSYNGIKFCIYEKKGI